MVYWWTWRMAQPTSGNESITVKLSLLCGMSHNFLYQFRSNGSEYSLEVPLQLRLTQEGAKELALRLIQSHNLPCYLEADLTAKLERHARDVSLRVCDEEAEQRMEGGSVFEKGSETDQVIDEWATSFSEHHLPFSPSIDSSSDRDTAFSEAYHKLIHSQTLETLLQLEHTYAFAVSEVCRGRENAMEILQARHEDELKKAMEELETTGTEREVNLLMRQHAEEREAVEKQWSDELGHVQDTQRKEYREWVLGVYSDTMAATDSSSAQRGNVADIRTPQRVQQDNSEPVENSFSEDDSRPLEESFTIFLGAQQKRMHNLRLLCGDPLDLCRHKTTSDLPGRLMAQPERLLTAMSLYSNKLSALVLLVDDRISTHRGMKEAFANVCHQSTDFHFPDINLQLQQAREYAATAITDRRDSKCSTLSINSRNSESQLSLSLRSESPSDPSERVPSTSDFHKSASGQLLTPPHPSPARSSTPTPTPPHFTVGPPPGGGRNHPSPVVDNDSIHLEPGDFYITHHSNLSQAHVVFHLVTDASAVQSASLRNRHPIIAGLKNCLRTAARHDIHHITVPLLLVHHMRPEMTINWCLKRAELVMKCVKGFMLENTSWGEGNSRTVQFLTPRGISDDAFEEFCEMLPKIFRVASTRVFSSRATSYRLKH